MTYEEILSKIPAPFTTSEFRDNKRIHVAPLQLYTVLEFLKLSCGFDMLLELSAADYLQYPNARDRFGIWYILLNTSTGLRIVVKTFVNEPDPTLPSVFSLWKGADWMEREVFDFYGVIFDGHPDLRRILLPDEFTAYPMRKDYPLRGRGERHHFNPITRADS